MMCVYVCASVWSQYVAQKLQAMVIRLVVRDEKFSLTNGEVLGYIR